MLDSTYSVILVEPEYAGNLGFIARVLKNFDGRRLIMVSPKCNIEEAYIYAAHARDVIESAIILDSYIEALSMVDFTVGTTSKVGGDYNVLRIPITPRMLAGAVKNFTGEVGIIFGRESRGLTNMELELCDLIVSIPSSRHYRALNISHAVAIILYELYLAAKHRGYMEFREASKIEKRMLIEYFDKLLERIEYHPFKKRIASIIFKHIIGRAFISGREAHTLMGVFRKTLMKLRENES